jgi:ArsR family transcriptional regulator
MLIEWLRISDSSAHDFSRFQGATFPHFQRWLKNMKKLIDKDEDILQAALAMKSIAHPLRLKVLCVLGAGELSVQEIVDSVGTSQSNISQHLAILRDKGILSTRKDANRVYYRVGDQRTLKLVGMMRDVFCSI